MEMSMKMKKRTVKNRMTHNQFFQVCQELMANAVRIKTERPGYNTVAAEFSKKLGFLVSAGSLRAARKSTTIDWDAPASLKGRHDGGVKTKGITRSTVVKLLDSMKVVVNEVGMLHIGLGNKVPERVMTLQTQLDALSTEFTNQQRK